MFWGGGTLFSQDLSGKIGVVTTTLPLTDFVEQVGGEHVSASAMVPPGADPHTYEPSPSQLKILGSAKLYVAVGSGVEFELAWLDKLKASNEKLVFCNSSIGIQMMNTGNGIPGGRHKEREHKHADPHVWLSPKNAVLMTKNIRDSLIELDPKNGAFYQSRFESFAAVLRQLDFEIKNTLARASQRSFIVHHPAWGYFARDYRLSEIAIEVDGKEPSASRIVGLVREAKSRAIKTIFASPQFSQKSAYVIANEISGNVILVDDLAMNSVDNMRKTAKKIAHALK